MFLASRARCRKCGHVPSQPRRVCKQCGDRLPIIIPEAITISALLVLVLVFAIMALLR